MQDFSQVQKEVLAAFREITVGYARVQLWRETVTLPVQFDDLEDIEALPEQYFWKQKKSGALALTVQLLPSPSLFTGTDL